VAYASAFFSFSVSVSQLAWRMTPLLALLALLALLVAFFFFAFFFVFVFFFCQSTGLADRITTGFTGFNGFTTRFTTQFYLLLAALIALLLALRTGFPHSALINIIFVFE
jgi:hypothetical protein